MVAVVVTVRVEVCDAPSTIEDGANPQVGGEARLDGATLHVSATVPVNPPVGATVITDVPGLPATGLGLLAELSVNDGPAATATETAEDAGETV